MPPLISVPWTNLNPDMVGVVSNDQSAGAAAVTIQGNIGGPMGIHIQSAQAFADVVYAPTATDNAVTIATELCSQINAMPNLKAANIACQLQGSIVGVTHHIDNAMWVTALSAGLRVDNGSLAWDAGPILVCERVPGGEAPPPGSSICQILMGSSTSTNPNAPTAQYVMLQGKVLDSSAAGAAGQLEIYTVKPDGQGNYGLRLVGQFFRGLTLCDAQVCAQDVGEGTLNVPPPHPDGLGPGIFLGTRKLCISSNNYIYAAEGAACPPGQ
jgi:hypothetical protein